MARTITLLDQDRGGEWDELLGRTIGSYRIVRLLGRGGMGAVYLARQPAIGAQVAIKLLHPRFSADPTVVERFFNEARAVNLIGHENILKILDFAMTPEGRHYFVMEYLEGRPLSALAAERKPIPLAVAGPIVLQCCRALQAAHARGIVHRDLKPDNVFLVQQMGKKHFVKLVDFGIAKLELDAEGAGLTQTGTVIGTPEYMSPEQAAGRTAEVGRRSDIYSLGVVIYQLACGRVPFSGPSTAETLVAHMQQAPPAPRSIEPSVPEELEAIVLKTLAKKKEDRFQSMQELHAALLAAMQKLGVSAELPPADEPAPEPAAGTGAEAPREIDPRFATRPPPATQTNVAGFPSQAERLAQLADWALARPRRLRTLALAGAAVFGLLLVARVRTPAPAPRPPLPRAAATPSPPPAPLKPLPAAQPEKPSPPKLLAPSPAQLALAEREKGHKGGKKEARAPARPAGAAPKAPATAAASPPAAAAAKPPAAAAAKPPPAAVAKPEAAAPRPPDQPVQPLTAAEAAKAAAAAARPKQKGESDEEKLARATREMTEAAAAAVREEAALPALPRSARLYVISDPVGASVTAAWAGKSATGVTPVVFKVLRGAKVTVTFSMPGFAPAVQEVGAGRTQVVVTALKKQP